jgi:quercetin dioxygenase-like cupin family protein
MGNAADRLSVALECEMEFEVEGPVHHPRPGEELLIEAGTLHSARDLP